MGLLPVQVAIFEPRRHCPLAVPNWSIMAPLHLILHIPEFHSPLCPQSRWCGWRRSKIPRLEKSRTTIFRFFHWLISLPPDSFAPRRLSSASAFLFSSRVHPRQTNEDGLRTVKLSSLLLHRVCRLQDTCFAHAKRSGVSVSCDLERGCYGEGPRCVRCEAAGGSTSFFQVASKRLPPAFHRIKSHLDSRP
jgi:hypothetical protein